MHAGRFLVGGLHTTNFTYVGNRVFVQYREKIYWTKSCDNGDGMIQLLNHWRHDIVESVPLLFLLLRDKGFEGDR